ncbi:Complement component C9 [Frankliniella fusca]|uniref:Complement component C9 n=1 Tax=Frankliniella fusca TaxID=407009 RepID=A0AAE1LVJ8_9NEOP|nr:Complement component C9 [Frankliniella fusca]
MKLSEGLWLDKHSLKLLGFVNMDQFTPEVQRDVPADHSLIMMFQGFKGQYFQSVSAHLSRGAVKGSELAKLIIEATRLLEDSGFYINAIVSDAAAWNRNMWSQFGIKKLNHEKEN